MKKGRLVQRTSRAIAAGLLALSLAACGDLFPCAPAKDWAVQTLGISLPKPPPINLSRLETDTVGAHYRGPIAMLAKLQAGDYAAVQAYWDQTAALPSAQEQFAVIDETIGALHARGLYFLGATEAWAQAQPGSQAARYMLGLVYAKAAMEGRGTAAAKDTSPQQLNQFALRFGQAEMLLDGLVQQKDFYSLAARAALVEGYFLAGQTTRGFAQYEALIDSVPRFGLLYHDAMRFSQPAWADEATQKRHTQRLQALAAKNKLSVIDSLTLAQTAQSLSDPKDRQISRNPSPQVWRPYWLARVKQAPTVHNLRAWQDQEVAAKNWSVVAEISDRVLLQMPHHRTAWYFKGYALKEMGLNTAGFSATLAAAVLGHDPSMALVIDAHRQGSLGRPAKDFSGMYEYCKLGAALGLPAAANCMASAHTEGFAGVPLDAAQAASWYLQAARGGYANAQHDLGVKLPTLVPLEQSEQATQAAYFWLSQAASQGQSLAQTKLASQPKPEPGWGCKADSFAAQSADFFQNLYTSILDIF